MVMLLNVYLCATWFIYIWSVAHKITKYSSWSEILILIIFCEKLAQKSSVFVTLYVFVIVIILYLSHGILLITYTDLKRTSMCVLFTYVITQHHNNVLACIMLNTINIYCKLIHGIRLRLSRSTLYILITDVTQFPN
jgi:hypothetical protein